MTFIFFRKSHNIFNILLLIVLHMIAFTSSLISTYISKSGITPFLRIQQYSKLLSLLFLFPLVYSSKYHDLYYYHPQDRELYLYVLEISTLQLLSCASCDMYLLLTILFYSIQPKCTLQFY